MNTERSREGFGYEKPLSKQRRVHLLQFPDHKATEKENSSKNLRKQMKKRGPKIRLWHTYEVLYLFTCMPRDLPTRRVFLSRSHFVSFIPLLPGVSVCACIWAPVSVLMLRKKYYYMCSPTQKWKKWRRSTTLFMSHSFRWRVGHPARAVFGTLRSKSWNASIHQK